MNLTDGLAIYGAILSSFIFYWNIRTSKANLKAIIVHSSETNEMGKWVSGIRIQVQNPSQHTAHLNSITLLYPWRKATLLDHLQHVWKFRRVPTRTGWCHTSLSNYEIEDGLPVSIEANQSYGVFIPQNVIDELKEASIKPVFRVMVQDALWRNRYSQAFSYEL